MGFGNDITDELLITNVGKVRATDLDVLLTLPADGKVHLDPDWDSVTVTVTGCRSFTIRMPDIVFGEEFALPSDLHGFDLSYLDPGETMTISMEHNVVNNAGWIGTLVFDALVSAWEIPWWKYPRAMHSIIIGAQDDETPFEGIEYLWAGWKLLPDGYGGWVFTYIYEWPILLPMIRMPFPPQGSPRMILDPVPEDLNNDGKIDGQDVALVRQAIVGLIPYDYKMDINVNHKVDTFDLAQYKLAAD
jgi:hypothetical protein